MPEWHNAGPTVASVLLGHLLQINGKKKVTLRYARPSDPWAPQREDWVVPRI